MCAMLWTDLVRWILWICHIWAAEGASNWLADCPSCKISPHQSSLDNIEFHPNFIEQNFKIKEEFHLYVSLAKNNKHHNLFYISWFLITFNNFSSFIPRWILLSAETVKDKLQNFLSYFLSSVIYGSIVYTTKLQIQCSFSASCIYLLKYSRITCRFDNALFCYNSNSNCILHRLSALKKSNLSWFTKNLKHKP